MNLLQKMTPNGQLIDLMINSRLLSLTTFLLYPNSNTLITYTNCNKASHEVLEDLNELKIDDTYKGGMNFDPYKEIPIQAMKDNGLPTMDTFKSIECDDIVHDNIRRC